MSKDSNYMVFYKPATYSIYKTRYYVFEPGYNTNAQFGLKYYGGIFVSIYSLSTTLS